MRVIIITASYKFRPASDQAPLNFLPLDLSLAGVWREVGHLWEWRCSRRLGSVANQWSQSEHLPRSEWRRMTVLTQTIVSPRLSLVNDIKTITNNNNVQVMRKGWSLNLWVTCLLNAKYSTFFCRAEQGLREVLAQEVGTKLETWRMFQVMAWPKWWRPSLTFSPV